MAALPYTYLGSLELSPHLLLPDAGQPAMLRSITRTFGGIVQQRLSSGAGREMTLTAEHDGAYYGFFTFSQKLALESMRDAAEPVLLRHHMGEWTVLVLEVNLEFSRPLSGANLPGTAKMYGTVKVKTVT